MADLRRICFVSISPFPGFYLPELRHMSDELGRQNFEQIIICRRQVGEAAEEDDGHRQIIRLWARNRLEVETFFWRAARIIRRERPDVIHVIWRFGAGIIPLTLGRLRGRCLLDIRTGSIDQGGLRRWWENFILHLDRRCFPTATTVDEPLAQALHIHVDAVLPHGTSRELQSMVAAPADRAATRRQVGFNEHDIVAIYIGTAWLRHLDRLMAGFARVRQTEPRLRLLIIGDAILNPHLQRAAEETKTVLLPSLPYEALGPFLAMADFGVSFVPITPGFTYQQSTKIIDFLAFHLPIIATRTASNGAFIRDGINGVLIGDSVDGVAQGCQYILSRLNDASFQSHAHRADDDLLQRYDWPTTVSTTLIPLYQKLCQR